MTPDLFWQFVREFGLPFALVSLGLVGLVRGWVVTRGEHQDKQAESDNWKALFERERTDRIAAEANLAKFATANAEVAEAVREALVEVVKRPDPYAERISGTTRRGR